jgi:protein SCO1/2
MSAGSTIVRALSLAAALGLADAPRAGAAPEPPRPAVLNRAGFDNKLGAQVPVGLTFRNEAGEVVRLSDYLGQGPVVLSLAYYECPMLCTLVLNGMTDCFRGLPFEIGKDYQVLTVSFDPTEKPPLAAAKKARYLKELDRPGGAEGWHFLTGDEAEIRQLTEAVGFKYAYDEASGEYAHASGIMLLTPEGRLSHYFYGIEYAPKDVRLGLVQASQGTIGSPVDQILLLCYHYNPATGTYGAALMNIVRAGCFATIAMLGGYLLVAFRRASAAAARKAEAGAGAGGSP